MLICSPNKTVSTDPVFRIQNNLIVRKPKAKYLGHIISEDISDDADVFRQVKCLYIRGNIISRKCANCSINAKLVVFKTYCSCLYTSQLWGTCLSRTMNRINVAYQARNQGGFGGFVRTPLFANPPSKNTNPPPPAQTFQLHIWHRIPNMPVSGVVPPIEHTEPTSWVLF